MDSTGLVDVFSYPKYIDWIIVAICKSIWRLVIGEKIFQKIPS